MPSVAREPPQKEASPIRSLLAILLVVLTPLAAVAERPVPERQGQEEVGDIPPILYSSILPAVPTFVAADVAIGPDGELNTKVLDRHALLGLTAMLDNFNRGVFGTDCVPYGPVYVERPNALNRSSITAAARTSDLILEGSVVGRDYGFYKGDIPGQLLAIKPGQVLHGQGVLDLCYVFYPVGRFKAGPYTFCKTDSRLPLSPELGQQVVLLIHEVVNPREPFLDLYDENSVIVLDQEGIAHLPESFTKVKAKRVTTEEVLSEIRTVVRAVK